MKTTQLKSAPRKNIIGEFFEEAKILNEAERINALTDEINKRAASKKQLVEIKEN